jgi:putative ABC transport system ATP-binding protein
MRGNRLLSRSSGPTMPRVAVHSEGPAAMAVDLTKTYGGGDTEVRALDGINVSFTRGEMAAIMGPSGSGKSTLMHCLAGLDRVTSGRAMLGTEDLATCSDDHLTAIRREQIGFIFQQFNLIPTLSAIENIMLPTDLAGRRPDAEWVDEVVATVGLASRLHHRPNELSGGQQQRVAVARALVGRPEVIFADEPTGNLDSQSGTEVLQFLRWAARELGQTIIMVTHDPDAASYADRVVFLVDGRLVAELVQPSAEALLAHMAGLGR